MVVWMYYHTDDDSGYYHIRLFSTQEKALAYKKLMNDNYSQVTAIEVK